jgi:hypothetical protein
VGSKMMGKKGVMFRYINTWVAKRGHVEDKILNNYQEFGKIEVPQV